MTNICAKQDIGYEYINIFITYMGRRPRETPETQGLLGGGAKRGDKNLARILNARSTI